jgi:DNA-binding MarR family transcriptional regulator
MSYSPFNPFIQEKNIESKIVVALERISEVFRILLWNQTREYSLSPVQIQILIYLLYHPEERCTVSKLSEEYNLTCSTISDSIKRLFEKKLIEKKINPGDQRSFYLILTKSGRKIAEEASRFAEVLHDSLYQLSEQKKKDLFFTLLTLISNMNKKGVIKVQRMCFSCSNYENKNGKHFCNLLQMFLKENELRIDCPDHIEK